ncbi:hypothetical protein [Aquisphaera giovannonii]|uniref:hypothetical protein n=1 Tax=Aquisphaera giovannonii TaxID=406548 RepID=UPI0011DF747E|nr:hypothetical protein [Aquisphaera giovannonii]
MTSDLPAALAAASEICTGESSRYALDCVPLRGSAGEVLASDDRQVLIRSGIDLPGETTC